MNITRTSTRRTFLRNAAIGGAALFGIAALPGIRQVLAQSGPGQYTCEYDGVRLRDNYGLASNTIGTLNVGDVVNITGDSVSADGYTWIPVTVNATGTAGWTALEFFSPVLGTIIWPAGTVVHVASDNVNLRYGPGLGYAVIGSYDTGTTATIVAGPEENDGYSWHKIEIDGTVGWMATNFLAEGAGNGNTGGWAPGTTVHVTSDNVNMRSGVGLGKSVLASFSAGSTGVITAGPFPADGYTWYELRIDGSSGFMAGEYLAEGTGRAEPTGARLRVVDGPLNLRTGGGLDYGIIASLPTGTVVVIKDASFGQADGYIWMWVEVEDNPSLSGWIAQGFTQEI